MPSHFDDFFSWLSPDGEGAERKYKELRRKLVQYFTRRGCHIPDELADETVDRASKSIAEGKVDRSVDPQRYCFGVAKNVLREYQKRPQPDPLPNDVRFIEPRADRKEREAACLEECLGQLSERDRDLVTRWHQCKKGREKIETHKKMAEQEGGINALRIRIHRIMNILRDCVPTCLRREAENLMQ
jgi:hypothetical protein